MPKQRKTLSEFLEKYYELIESTDEVEEWKDIEYGEVPLYEISNHGRVRRKDNKLVINPFHSYRKDKDGKWILDRPTYLRVQLYGYFNSVRKKKHFEISRLVAKHFIPIPDEYTKQGLTEDDLQVNHIHGGYEIYNNFTSNLEWCTCQENIDKAFESGLRHPKYGEGHHSTFFTVSDVTQICECLEQGMGARDTYDKIHLSSEIPYKRFKGTFFNIKYKNSWKFISRNYDF